MAKKLTVKNQGRRDSEQSRNRNAEQSLAMLIDDSRNSFCSCSEKDKEEEERKKKKKTGDRQRIINRLERKIMRYKTENETMNNGGKQSRVSTNSPILQRINTKKKTSATRRRSCIVVGENSDTKRPTTRGKQNWM
jgi:hypothetical protein